MASLYDLTPMLAAQAPYAPDPILGQALVDTVRDLCQDCLCWTYEPDPVHTATGEAFLDLYDLPVNSEVLHPEQVIVDGWRVTPTTAGQLRHIATDWALHLGSPQHFLMVTPNQLRLWPTPDGEHSVFMRLYLTPTRNATILDDTLVSRTLDALLAGALSRLFALPDRDWTQSRLAAGYRMDYELAKRRIRSQAVDGFVTGVARRVMYGGY